VQSAEQSKTPPSQKQAPQQQSRESAFSVAGQRAGKTYINSKDGLTYVWIPSGKFKMGCSRGDIIGSGSAFGKSNQKYNITIPCPDNEEPAHDVTITKGFWIGQTEVTQEAYQKVIGDNPSNFKGAKLPVEEISGNNADAYCRAIGARLPTEAEWEYAARAGSTTSRYGDVYKIARYDTFRPHEVAQKAPNAWGLHDMLGNVNEWTADWYADKLSVETTDPKGPTSGALRTLRGGSYNSSLDRAADFPDRLGVGAGLRCVGDSP